MTEQPRPRTQITDASGKATAANVRRIRERRGLSTYDLSRRLGQAGRPITPSALAKVERAERRVDVGDLMALAAVLGVSPSALLLPLEDSPEKTVEITGVGAVAADAAWDWADGKRPLPVRGRDDGEVWLEFELYGRPLGRRIKQSDAAFRHRELRDAGVPVDDLLRKIGLIEPSDGD